MNNKAFRNLFCNPWKSFHNSLGSANVEIEEWLKAPISPFYSSRKILERYENSSVDYRKNTKSFVV